MRNVLVLGSGRSGTSMLAGAFAHAGWFVGADPYPARDSNPKGFFESKEINGVNEHLLALAAPRSDLGPWQRWLIELAPDVPCPTDARARERIARLVRNAPYCFKDPRLAYTLPAWSPFTQDALRVCVFRHPEAVARSIVKECAQEDYLRSVAMSRERALSAWLAMHRRIVDELRADGEWLFVHCDQVIGGDGVARIEALVGAPLARDFPEAGLQRQRADGELEGALKDAYEELCELAQWPATRSPRSISAPRARAAVEAPFDAVAKRATEVRTALTQAVERFLATGDESAPELARAPGSSAAAGERKLVDALPSIAALAERVRAGGATARAAQQALDEIARLEGLLDVFESHGARSWIELRAAAAWPLRTSARVKVLSWPRWTVSELAQLLELWCAAVPQDASACLCLRHDPDVDGETEAAFAALEQAYTLACDPSRAVEVLVIGSELADSDGPRLARAIDGVLTSGADSERRRFAQSLHAPSACDVESLAELVAAGAAR